MDTSGAWTCGVIQHAAKFQPTPATFYVRGNEFVAFCSPSFPVDVVPANKLDSVIKAKNTVADWSSLFKEFVDFRDASSVNLYLGYDVSVPLKTPAKAKNSTAESDGFQLYMPAGLEFLSMEDTANGQLSEEATSLPKDLQTFVRNVRAFLMDYKQWWRTPLNDVFDALNNTKGDLHSLKHACERIRISIGRPIVIDGLDFPNVWLALEHVAMLNPTLQYFNVS
jgi:hypothetical protein